MINPLLEHDLAEVFKLAEMGGSRRAEGHRDAEITHRYGLSAVRFFQLINWTITDPEVYARYPMQCARLTRLRDLRAAQRSAARLR